MTICYPSEGDTWRRMSDLSDGSLDIFTWEVIKKDIITLEIEENILRSSCL